MAGVIKASTGIPASQTAHGSSFNFADMGDKANAYVAEVRARAAQIIADARTEAEQIKAKAQADGRAAALKAAEAAITSKIDGELRKVLPALETASTQVAHVKEGWQRHWEKNLVKLATGIAEKVIRRKVEKDPEIPLALIKEALDLATSSQRLTLHMHPADRELIGERVHALTARMAKLGPVQVVSDETVTRGGCRVHTEYGVIDQTLEAQLKRIENELA